MSDDEGPGDAGVPEGAAAPEDDLPDAALDRGLRTAFCDAAADGGVPAAELPTIGVARSAPGGVAGVAPVAGVLDSIRATYGVAPAIDIDDDGPGPLRVPQREVAQPASRYLNHGEIARGGMGAIYRVRDRDLRRSLAMKVLLGRTTGPAEPNAPVPAELLNRFLEEAQVTAQLAHPGVVPVHELGMDADGRVFFTMQLVRGRTLSEIIQLARKREDGWTRTRALQVILRVCETLAFAHDKGVIHRDVKPDNVMIGRFGETYLMDWGLAKVLDRADLHDLRLREPDPASESLIETKRDEHPGGGDSPIMTMDGVVVGTPAYMPPEQARGAIADVDERADIYAVGALLYELLTGRAPYVEPGTKVSPRVILGAVHMGPPKPVREIEPDLPDEIVAICEKAMARERADRYGSAQALADDIQAFIEGRVVQAYRTGPVVEAEKWIGRNRALAASLAAGLLLAIGGSIAFGVHANRAAATERAERVRAEGLRLSARAGNEGERNPGLALGLAIEGAARADDPYGRTALYRALANLNEVATLERHPSYIDSVGISADGHRLLSFSTNGRRDRGELVVWDADSRKPLRYAEIHDGPIARGGIVWARDRAATVGLDDGTVRVWNVADGACLQTLAPGGDVAALGWDRDGARLAVMTATGRLAVWHVGDAEPLLDVALAVDHPLAVALRPDGAKVAVQFPDGSVAVRDVGTGAVEQHLAAPGPHADAASQEGRVLWLDDGRLLLAFRDDPGAPVLINCPRLGWTDVWDIAAAQRVATFGDGEERSGSAITDAGVGTLALMLSDREQRTRTVVAWDAAQRCESWRVDGVPEHRLYCLSPEGRYLVGAFLTGDVPPFSLALRDGRTGRLAALLRGHTYGESSAAVTDAGLVATTAGDTTVRLWRASSPLTFAGTAGWDLGDAHVVRLLCDGRRALIADAAHHQSECRSVPDGTRVYGLPQVTDLGRVAVDRVRDRLAVADETSGRVRIVDALDGRVLRELPAPSSWEPGAYASSLLQFSPDGALLLRWSKGTFERFDPADGSLVGSCATDLQPCWPNFVWCPEGRSILLSTGADRRILEVDVATGAVVRAFEGVHTGLPTGIAVSPTGTLVATCAADTSLALWDRATATLIGRISGLYMGDLTPTFDPTGRFLVVRDQVDTVTIVDVERRAVFAEIDLPGWGATAFVDGDLVVAGDASVLRVPLDPLAAARRAEPRPLIPLELANFDVGDDEERAALTDRYVAWTFSPNRVLYLALAAVAKGDTDRARRYLARIEEIDPSTTERLVVRAALELARGDRAAALRTLGDATDAGCGARPLRHPAFESLRGTADWDTLSERLAR